MFKKPIAIPFVLLFLITFFLSVSVVQSASLKERMAARIPAISSLKDQGVIGENNQGFLEFRGNKRPQKDMVDAENSDRQKVYEMIGKQQSASSTLVGQRRAKTIAQKSRPGHWFQNSDESWHKK